MEHKHHLPTSLAEAKSSLAKDPVCGMSVNSATAKHKAEPEGAAYYFCSAGCREKFIADPARYVAALGPVPLSNPAPPGAIYTCPMHPQIRQDHPGNCPICGMNSWSRWSPRKRLAPALSLST